MKLSSTQYVAGVLGLSWLGLQTWMLVEHSGFKPEVPAATVTLALLPVLVETALRARQKLMALSLGLLFALLIGYSLPTAIARSGEARDTKTAAVKVYDEAKAQAQQAKVAADKECKGGNGPKCKDLRAEQAKAEAKVPQTPTVGNSDAPRLAALLAPIGVTEKLIELYQPLFLPLANELGVWALLWMALSPSLMVKVEKKKRRKARKAKVVATITPRLVAANTNAA